MGRLGELFSQVNTFGKKVIKLFNPIGKFYIQVISLIRVLVVTVFLDDLFEDVDKMECETAQIGCDLVCENRWAPIDIHRLWSFELFVILLSISVYSFINLLGEYQHKKMLKHYAKERINREMYSENKYKSLRFEEKQLKGDEKMVISIYTRIGYISMLIFRLCCEICCLYIEAALCQHMSQNEKFTDWFQLKEYWKCLINKSGEESEGLLALPLANRSSLWFREDVNNACHQQEVAVKCWIPLSRMKSLGIHFMFLVMCFQVMLTLVELGFEIYDNMRKRCGQVDSQYMQSIRGKNV